MAAQENWWESFYEGPFGEIQVHGSHMQTTTQDVDRVTQALGANRQRILDAPCGAGRHSLELARRGHSVVGLDFNKSVLQAARDAADAERLEVEFRHKDLRTLTVREEFDAVICLWSSIGYFSEADNDKMIWGLADAVKPGGFLFIDAQATESVLRHFSVRDWSWWGEGPERVRVLNERRWNALSSRSEETWTFQRDGREQVRETSIRVYSCHELVSKLRDAGFTRFEATDPNGATFTVGSSRLWLEAQKPA